MNTATRTTRAAASLLGLSLLVLGPGTAMAAEQALSGRAHELSAQAFRDMDRGDPAAAESNLREALRLAPEHPQLQLQMADALARQGRAAEAIVTYDRLLLADPDNARAVLARAYLRYQNGEFAAAMADFQSALQLGLPADAARSAQLGWADAALAEELHEQVMPALAGLPDTDFAVVARRAQAQGALGQREAAVASWRLAEAATTDSNQRATAIRARVQILRDADRIDAANQEILDGVHRYPDNRPLMLDAAYVALAAGDDAAALQRFSHGAEDIDAPANALVDAAYTANRLRRSQEAAKFFRMSIDRHFDDPEKREVFSEQQWFGMRRQIQEIEREFGFQAALFHRGNAFLPGVAGDDVWQASVEVFWQPPRIGYRGGRILQLFLRGVQTLDAPGLVRPAESRLASFGARYKPFANLSMVLTAERVVGLGDLIEDDWLLRAGYSYDHGIDLQPWRSSWSTINGFVEAVRFVEAKRDVIGAQARIGRSFAVGTESWVLLPHLGLVLDYDSAQQERFAGAIGPGLAVRWWHRGGRYWAPPSYVDLQMQYRYHVGGDDRNQGLAAQLVWYY